MSRLCALAAALLTAVVFSAGAGAPAEAVGEYTPHGGPEINFVGSNVVFSVDSTGQATGCLTFDLLGELIDPGVSRTTGDYAGIVDDLTAIGCINPLSGDVDVTPHGEWGLAVTGPESSSVTPVTLYGVELTANLLSGACTYDIIGDIGAPSTMSTRCSLLLSRSWRSR